VRLVEEAEMIHEEYGLFAGLDVSLNRTSLCIVDSSGDVI
jgi:hypothetical protein